ncbi:MAG: hypothetical protein LKJ88_08220 [Bacilli bacterium]|jgi:hypothetical protein|nr:hypothetical protein [Bacilli bacterium]
MIIIKLLGVDQYQAASFVEDIQDQVAQAFETEPENILFYAPDSFLIYRGVDQTSYQLVVEIQAPMKYHPIEEQASEVLIKIFSQNHVHVRLVFDYFEEEHEHEFVNEEYPRFMTKGNMAHFDSDQEEGEEPYMGDAFENFEEKKKAKEEEQQKEEQERQSKRTDK